MTIYDLSKNQTAIIQDLNSQQDLKNRLLSFGIRKGTKIKIQDIAPKKSTISLLAGKSVIALRDEEAKKIQVELA